jgi:microcystin-dependent protein
MGTPYLSEIKIMSFGFAPQGWALCNGQLLSISQNTALFSILGTFYGGNGSSTFALPNLQASVPIHVGGGQILGSVGGEESHTLSISEMPVHLHSMSGTSTTGTLNQGIGNVLGVSQAPIYAPPANTTTLNPGTITKTGGSQPHENRQPFLTLSFCIALQGIYPSRN